jgi:hypothetical protein
MQLSHYSEDVEEENYMNTNALPQTGGIPLRAQPLEPGRRQNDQNTMPQQASPATINPYVTNQFNSPPQSPGISIQQQPQPAPAQTMADKPTEQQLREAIGHASDILMTATTVFPFTLFPDTITVDRSKFSVNKRFFFAISEAFSIRVEDILNVTADTGPFFGAIRVSTRFFTDKEPFEVDYLWRSDALRLKRILQGYIIATKKKIDCSAMPADKLSQMLDDLGKGAPGER